MSDTATRAIGIDLGGTVLKYALVGDRAQTDAYGEAPTPAGADEILRVLRETVQSLLVTAKENGFTVSHVGIATPGVVDIDCGVVLSGAHNIPGWSGVAISETLAAQTGLPPVYVDNDANAMALAELSFGAAHGASSAICLTIGTGIGGALITHGGLWRGATFAAGEIGQISLADSAEFGDGKSSSPTTLESQTATKALVRNMKRRTGRDFTPREIVARYHSGDNEAVEEIECMCKTLGDALANLVNVLNPERVILGGGVVDAIPGVVKKIESVIMSRAIPVSAAELSVVRADLGNRAGVVGAALLGG